MGMVDLTYNVKEIIKLLINKYPSLIEMGLSEDELLNRVKQDERYNHIFETQKSSSIIGNYNNQDEYFLSSASIETTIILKYAYQEIKDNNLKNLEIIEVYLDEKIREIYENNEKFKDVKYENFKKNLFLCEGTSKYLKEFHSELQYLKEVNKREVLKSLEDTYHIDNYKGIIEEVLKDVKLDSLEIYKMKEIKEDDLKEVVRKLLINRILKDTKIKNENNIINLDKIINEEIEIFSYYGYKDTLNNSIFFAEKDLVTFMKTYQEDELNNIHSDLFIYSTLFQDRQKELKKEAEFFLDTLKSTTQKYKKLLNIIDELNSFVSQYELQDLAERYKKINKEFNHLNYCISRY